MKTAFLLVALAATAACGSSSAKQALPTGNGSSEACPDVGALREATFRDYDLGGAQYGAPINAWYVELGWHSSPEEDGGLAAPAEREPGMTSAPIAPGKLTAAQLEAAGLELPEAMYIWTDTGGAACQAEVTGIYGITNNDAYPFVDVFAATTGCPAPIGEGWHSGWAVADVEPSAACQWVPAKNVDAQTMSDHDEPLPWTVPPPPAPWQSVLTPPSATDCADCTELWALREVPGVEPKVSSLMVTWLPAAYVACQGNPPAIDAYSLYVTPAGGRPLAIPDSELVDLDGAFQVKGQAQILMVSAATWWFAWPVAGGQVEPKAGASGGHPHHEEDGVYRSLDSYCGP